MSATPSSDTGYGRPLPRRNLGVAFLLACAPGFLSAQEPGQQEQAYVPVPGDPSAHLEAGFQDKLGRWDPTQDDWASEGWNQAAQEQLNLLVKSWRPGEEVEAEVLASLLEPGCKTMVLRPTRWSTVFEDDAFRVRRPAPDAWAHSDGFEGASGFQQAIGALLEPYPNAEQFYAKLKIFSIEEQDGRLTTAVRGFLEGQSEGRRLQQMTTWTCTWILHPDRAPTLLEVRVLDFEETRGPASGKPLFADQTLSMFGDDPSYRLQLLPSMGYWQGRLAADLGFSDQSHQGVAIGDVNGDGLEDLFLPQPGGLPNRLYLHQPDGTLLDHSEAAGVDFLDASRCALLLDLDNDGDLDLVTNLGADLVFLSNDGSGRFRIETSGNAPEVTTLAAADIDGDGFLEVYVCRYLNPYEDRAVPTPYHDAENGLDNVLLRLTEGWEVQDVTAEVGLDVNNQRFSFAASWEDYDNDGDQDLYVANDFGRNNLYRNDGGRFTDVAAEAGVEDISAGMGVSWGDYDNDGWMDLYVSNMYSSAGNRVTYQRDFRPDAGEEDRRELQRHARGNSMFRNLGNGTFQDVTLALGVERGRWAWGSVFADINNDARLDLLVPNGFVTNDRDDDL